MTSDNEQDKKEASVELLRTLRKKLVSGNISDARAAAHNLSWLQEDGLAVLKEALFGDYPRAVKQAATYGLRKFNGRMTKIAVDVLEQGLQVRDRITREACGKSLFLLKGQNHETPTGRSPSGGRQRIAEIPRRGRQVKPAMPRRSYSNR
jgi:hypothetical protein